MADVEKEICDGKCFLGIEFGSTRIKALLIDGEKNVVASGAFDWENTLLDGIWTYSLEEMQNGLRAAYGDLKKNVREKYKLTLTKIRAMGISAMMHGYLAFDDKDDLLVPFRTWRNTITAEASGILSRIFDCPIPERWSVAHLYQAVLNGEDHVSKIAWITTLAGYVHYKMTGEKILGIGDASGTFPLDYGKLNYDQKLISIFNGLLLEKNIPWKLENLLPEVRLAGQSGGFLTKEGALFLDPSGDLLPASLMAPPEGDAGTGMVATNSVRECTGNVSAGTSVFAMAVLQKPLEKTYNGIIDIVSTPDGKVCAMVHANNCTGEYDKWINLFGQAASLLGAQFDKNALYEKILSCAKNGAKDGGGLIPFNYISGESITSFAQGRPLFVREENAVFNLPNFMRAQLYTSLCALRQGMDILFEKENVSLECLTGHGGFFKTGQLGASIMAAAMHTPLTLMSTAGEGGPWGMALLASYAWDCQNGAAEPLAKWLDEKVFSSSQVKTFAPQKDDVEGFNAFFEKYKRALAVERAAVENVD